jgi:peptidoglycan/xylan/chitin deacetylase (PgdA/CDA1 family)
LLRLNELSVRLQRQKLLVLCYHGVLTAPRTERWGYENCVDQSAFRGQLRWLKRHFEPIDLVGLERWHRGEWTRSKSPVLITFDDGYRNNLTVAAPLLQEEGCPALFFLSTGYIGTQRVLWNDEVRLRVMNWPEGSINLPSGTKAQVTKGYEAQGTLARQIAQACKRLTEEQRCQYLAYLRSNTTSVGLMADREAREFMDWSDARMLSRMGFEVGSHTVEHPILSAITDRAVLIRELQNSKQRLEQQLEKPCVALAYPNGTARDVNPQVFREVQAAGYRWAFMTTPLWQAPGCDPHQIARICVPGHTDMPTFALYASGVHSRLAGAG